MFASCRPHAALAGTQRWLRANGLPAGSVITGLSREGKIRLVVEDFQPAMVFEGDPVIAVALAGRVPAVWVKDWPYNRRLVFQSPPPPGVLRFHSWREWRMAAMDSPDADQILGMGWNDAEDVGHS